MTSVAEGTRLELDSHGNTSFRFLDSYDNSDGTQQLSIVRDPIKGQCVVSSQELVYLGTSPLHNDALVYTLTGDNLHNCCYCCLRSLSKERNPIISTLCKKVRFCSRECELETEPRLQLTGKLIDHILGENRDQTHDSIDCVLLVIAILFEICECVRQLQTTTTTIAANKLSSFSRLSQYYNRIENNELQQHYVNLSTQLTSLCMQKCPSILLQSISTFLHMNSNKHYNDNDNNSNKELNNKELNQWIYNCLCVAQLNAQTIKSNDNNSLRLIALFSTLRLINHNCKSNGLLLFSIDNTNNTNNTNNNSVIINNNKRRAVVSAKWICTLNNNNNNINNNNNNDNVKQRELTMNYLVDICLFSSNERKELLNTQFGFNCCCEFCSVEQNNNNNNNNNNIEIDNKMTRLQQLIEQTQLNNITKFDYLRRFQNNTMMLIDEMISISEFVVNYFNNNNNNNSKFITTLAMDYKHTIYTTALTIVQHSTDFWVLIQQQVLQQQQNQQNQLQLSCCYAIQIQRSYLLLINNVFVDVIDLIVSMRYVLSLSMFCTLTLKLLYTTNKNKINNNNNNNNNNQNNINSHAFSTKCCCEFCLLCKQIISNSLQVNKQIHVCFQNIDLILDNNNNNKQEEINCSDFDSFAQLKQMKSRFVRAQNAIKLLIDSTK